MWITFGMQRNQAERQLVYVTFMCVLMYEQMLLCTWQRKFAETSTNPQIKDRTSSTVGQNSMLLRRVPM